MNKMQNKLTGPSTRKQVISIAINAANSDLGAACCGQAELI
jgi:hypothetical protein